MEDPERMRAMQDCLPGTSKTGESLEARWQSLHQAANEIASKAALAAETMGEELQNFPARIVAAGGDRAFQARRGMQEIEAILQPGLTALRTIEARGRDTTAPALALWREFYNTRSALLALCPEESHDEASDSSI